MSNEPVRVGVVGCGNVSRLYLPIITQLKALKVVAVSDVVVDRAKEAATHYAVQQVTPERVLADPDVQLILNFTPIAVHAQVTQAALDAGKHVYSEKPLATSLRQSQTLVDAAKRRGLTLACAPDTLLGSGFQGALQALEAGSIGKPIAATAYMFRVAFPDGAQDAPGPTPFFDLGPYYVSALINLFGYARDVSAYSRQIGRDLETKAHGAPSILAGTIEFADGVFASVVLAWGTTHRKEFPFLTVFGSEGVLQLPNPNAFGEPAFYRPHGRQEWIEIAGSREPTDRPDQMRGIGVAEAAQSIQAGRTPRCSAEIALHVVEILEGMLESSAARAHVGLSTRCEKADALSPEERAVLLQKQGADRTSYSGLNW